MEIKRTLAANAVKRAEPDFRGRMRASATISGATGSSGQTASAFIGKERDRATEVTLIVEASKSMGTKGVDPGGTVDRDVRSGESYVYVAQRLTRVTLGGHELEMRGVASPPTAFAYQDTFPPGSPLGLVSVPTGGLGTVSAIDLSWEPNGENDLLGYNVYRREALGPPRKLNLKPVSSSFFRDTEVTPGHTYHYHVTAVDRRQNESEASPEIQEVLRD